MLYQIKTKWKFTRHLKTHKIFLIQNKTKRKHRKEKKRNALEISNDNNFFLEEAFVVSLTKQSAIFEWLLIELTGCGRNEIHS